MFACACCAGIVTIYSAKQGWLGLIYSISAGTQHVPTDLYQRTPVGSTRLGFVNLHNITDFHAVGVPPSVHDFAFMFTGLLRVPFLVIMSETTTMAASSSEHTHLVLTLCARS